MRDHLATLLDDFRRYDRQIAVVRFQGNRRRATTYGELARLAGRFAALLAQRGIGSATGFCCGEKTAPSGLQPFTAACCAVCWRCRWTPTEARSLPSA